MYWETFWATPVLYSALGLFLTDLHVALISYWHLIHIYFSQLTHCKVEYANFIIIEHCYHIIFVYVYHNWTVFCTSITIRYFSQYIKRISIVRLEPPDQYYLDSLKILRFCKYSKYWNVNFKWKFDHILAPNYYYILYILLLLSIIIIIIKYVKLG